MLTLMFIQKNKLPANIRKLSSKMQIFHFWNNYKEPFKISAANNFLREFLGMVLISQYI